MGNNDIIYLMEKDLLLKQIFGEGAVIISPLVGGMMNQSYIVSYKGKKYVLYISTEQANEMVDRVLERDNQKIVIDLGITSKNYYFDVKNGIKANEYIEGSSLDKADGFDSKKVAELLKKLHSSRTLSRNDYQPFKRFVAYEEEALSFQKEFDDEYKLLRDALFENKEFLERQPLALCHNDAQKSNIIKDFNGKYYLIDFEFMGNNDPIYDIATFGNGLVQEGYQCLVDYFGGKPTLEEKKRFYLWRIFVSLQWHNVAIVKHYRGEGKTHGFDFMQVAAFFKNNAKDALKGYQGLIK